MPTKSWVLISEGGSGESRAAVAAVRALAAEGWRPAVTVSGDLSLAGASRHCARRVAVPPVEEQPEEYAAAVRAELASGDYLTLFPASDFAIVALGLPVERFLDKVACAEIARTVGLEVPPSRVFESAEALRAAAGALEYPVVVKPDVKRCAAARLESEAALLAAIDRGALDGRVVVQPYLRDALRGVVGVAWRGRVVEAMHMRYERIWPLPCGTVACAVTVAPDVELEERLGALLAGYDGVFHADLAGPYLLDVNPRIHATLPLALAAGINPVVRYCELLSGASDTGVRRARQGVFFRWIEGDVRSVARSVREGRLGVGGAVRALAPRRGAVHSYESLRDIGPLWTRVRYLSRRLRSRGAGAR
ncbi:MAG TPA: hypothetical protein VFJ74_09995 [Gemmatimonadaceae bacterium]|nr:hypothetical protein [Gemmatimonadaceae bacterium]